MKLFKINCFNNWITACNASIALLHSKIFQEWKFSYIENKCTDIACHTLQSMIDIGVDEFCFRYCDFYFSKKYRVPNVMERVVLTKQQSSSTFTNPWVDFSHPDWVWLVSDERLDFFEERVKHAPQRFSQYTQRSDKTVLIEISGRTELVSNSYPLLSWVPVMVRYVGIHKIWNVIGGRL